MDKKEDFKIMELCWAKIKGFPWWPALIRDIKYSNNEKYYNIGYICESLGSDLDSSSLKKWQENYDEFKQGWTNPKDKKSLKQNDFDCSLAMADKISEGKLTPEDHDNYILKYKTKKIFVAYESKERIINKEFILPIFKNICQIVYKSLEEKLILHYKKKKYIIKRNILCLGFVYCQSSNIGKIRLFFDLFSKEGKFEKSNELNDFLISLFIIVSHSMVNARIEFSGKHKIPKLKENELNMTYRISELKDSENLLKYFNNNFFKDKKSFDYSEFREKFINKVDTYDWIFSPNGIRYKLEHNNY